MHRPNAVRNVRDFCRREGCIVAVLIGMLVSAAGDVQRDLAVVEVDDEEIVEDARKLLLTDEKASSFALSVKDERPGEYILFEQGNVKISRKQILPVVQTLIQSPPPMNPANEMPPN